MLPQIDASGVYELSLPFKVQVGETLTCNAIETFTSLELNGTNVYNAFYKAHGIPASVYASDLAAGEKIITLISDVTSNMVQMPSSYVLSAPSVSLAEYSNLFLTANMGLVPDTLDVYTTMNGFRDYISDITGVRPVVKLHKYPTTAPVTLAQASLLEANRLAAITDRRSAHAELTHWIAKATELEGRIDALEDALVALS